MNLIAQRIAQAVKRANQTSDVRSIILNEIQKLRDDRHSEESIRLILREVRSSLIIVEKQAAFQNIENSNEADKVLAEILGE